MSDTTSNDDDNGVDEEERGALAERAKRMLDRGKDVAAGVTGSSGAGGGSGGGGGSGSSGSDDDEDALIPGTGVSGSNQIVILGLVVAGLMLFGGTIWSFIGGGDDDTRLDDIVAPFDESIDSATDGPCGEFRDLLDDDDVFVGQDLDDVRCRRVGNRIRLTGAVASSSLVAGVGALAASVDSALELDNQLTVAGVDDNGDDDGGGDMAAADTTTAAPTTSAETTTTEAPPTTETETSTTAEATTTTEAETTTTEADTLTLVDVVAGSDDTSEFANLVSLLGLQDALDDTPTDLTLFVPSNEALAQIDPSVLADDGAADRIVNYHIVQGTLTAADLVELDGETIRTAAGLDIAVSVVDNAVVLNDTTTVVGADRAADNGVVHVIDLVLDVPTVNTALGLENIEFEVNSAIITGPSQAELQKAVDFFTANTDARASIEGHTDTDGGAESNQTLSEDRAAAVKDFLVAAGLDADRFTTAGFGETQPIVGEDGVEDKAASRRIEIILQ